MDDQCHKLPVNDFEWIENISTFNEDSIKNYIEESDTFNRKNEIEHNNTLDDLLPFT